MKRLYSTGIVQERAPAATPPSHASAPQPRSLRARIAVYDSLTACPRVHDVEAASPRDMIDSLAETTYRVAHDAGGEIPFMVIREIVENLIHADFSEAVVTVLDAGNTIRFADQGPGIPDKDRAMLPGFTTATAAMKQVIRGVGSGLPVVRECLAFSGGTISVEDNLERGAVVTLRMTRNPHPEPDEAQVAHEPLTPSPVRRLSTRQKQALSLIIEFGSVGPTLVSKELGVGLSTAYRDLASLEELGLVSSDESGKRTLTNDGAASLDALFGA